nr:hypothetical protein [Chroococcidiopsis sp. CCMEE 29]
MAFSLFPVACLLQLAKCARSGDRGALVPDESIRVTPADPVYIL